jgi:hypothetical protein
MNKKRMTMLFMFIFILSYIIPLTHAPSPTVTSNNATGIGETNATLNGIIANATTYHYRAFGNNSEGNSVGADKTFTTSYASTVTNYSDYYIDETASDSSTIFNLMGYDLVNNIYHVVYLKKVGSPYQIFHARSFDNGTTWSDILQVSTGSTQCSFPSLIVNSTGVVYIFYSKMTGDWSNDIFMTKSTDEGVSFSVPVVVSEGVWVDDSSDVVLDSTDKIHLFYRGYESMSFYRYVWYKNSTDGGTTWSVAKNISLPHKEAYYPCAVVDSNDVLHVSYETTSPTCLKYLNSSDSGLTWSTPVNITAMAGYDQDMTVLSNNTLVFTFYAGGKVYFTRSSDFLTWSAPVSIFTISSGFSYNSLCSDMNDTVYSVFTNYTFSGSWKNNSIWCLSSSDSGSTWSTPVRINFSKTIRYFRFVLLDATYPKSNLFVMGGSVNKGLHGFIGCYSKNYTGTSTYYEFFAKSDDYIKLPKLVGPAGLTISRYSSGFNLSWSKGVGANNTRIQGKLGGYPTNVSDGVNVYNGTGTSVNHLGLTGDYGQTWYYRAWSWGVFNGSSFFSVLYDEDYHLVVINPTVTTNTSTGVEETNATLQGYLMNDGGDSTSVGFNYGSTTSYTVNTSYYLDKFLYQTNTASNGLIQYWKSNLTVRDTITCPIGTVVNNYCHDNMNVYVGLFTDGKIHRYDVITLNEIDSSSAISFSITDISLDDNYIYLFCDSIVKQIWKSNLTLTTKEINYGASITNFIFDDTYIYITGYQDKVYQYWKSNLTKKAETIDYGSSLWGMADDDTYIYAGGMITKKVYKFWKSNMTKTPTEVDYGGHIWTIKVKDNYMYVGGTTVLPVILKKYYKTNFTLVTSSVNLGGPILYSDIDSTYIYATINPVPYNVKKIFLSNLSVVASISPSGGFIPVVSSQTYNSGEKFSYNLTSITPGMLYHYRAGALNSNGTAYGSDMTLLTKPIEPTALTITRYSTGFNLTWTKATSANNTIIRGTIGSYPATPTSGVSIYNGTASTTSHLGLSQGDTWYYRAWSYTSWSGLHQTSDAYSQANKLLVVNPTVTTNTSTGVEETNATLHGYLMNAGANTTNVGLQYGLTTTYDMDLKIGILDFKQSSVAATSTLNAVTTDDKYVYSAGATKKVMQYWKSNLTLNKTSGAFSQPLIMLSEDADYVYALLWSSPGRVYQIWKSNFTVRGNTQLLGSGLVDSFVTNNTHLFLPNAITYSISKFWKSTLLKESGTASVGYRPNCLSQNSTHVMIGTTKGLWRTMNKETMALSDVYWYKYDYPIRSLNVSGGYLFVGGDWGTIDKYDLSTCVKVAGSIDVGGCGIIKTSEDYVFISILDKVHCLWKSNLTYISASGSYGGNIADIALDSNFVYVVGAFPYKVYQYYIDGDFNSPIVFSHYADGLLPGTLYHYRAYATNSNGTSYGADMTFLTKPVEPTGLTITNTAAGTQTLSWTTGAGKNNTVIRAKIGSYPADPQSDIDIYNGTGTTTTVNNTVLTPGAHYYYRAWSYAHWGEIHKFSDVTSNISQVMQPFAPRNAGGVMSPPNINLSWINGTGSKRTVIVMKSTGYPTTVTDGTIIYNGTAEYYNYSISPGTPYYFSAWSFATGSSCFSYNYSIFGITGGGIMINCYDADTHAALTFNLLMSNPDGTDVQSNNSVTNPFILSGSFCVFGDDIGIWISASGHRNMVYTFDVSIGVFMSLNAYLPANTTSGTGGCSPQVFMDSTSLSATIKNYYVTLTHRLNSMISVEVYNSTLGYWTLVPNDKWVNNSNQTVKILSTMITTRSTLTMGRVNYYYQFCSGEQLSYLYYFQVVGQTTSSPISNASVSIKKYINAIGVFEIVSNMFTDSNGYFNVYLVPHYTYKIIVDADGYRQEIVDYVPSTITFSHTIRLSLDDIFIQPPIISPSSIHFTGVLGHFTGNSTYCLNLTYLDDTGYTNSTTLNVYAYNFTTNTSTLVGTYTTTSSQGWTVIIYNIDRNMTYICNLTYVHFYLGTQRLGFVLEHQIWIPITPGEVEDLFDWMGVIPFGAVNLLMFFLFMAICYYADARDIGKYTIVIGFIFLFLGLYVGLKTDFNIIASGSLPALFIVIGILAEWNNSKRRT